MVSGSCLIAFNDFLDCLLFGASVIFHNTFNAHFERRMYEDIESRKFTAQNIVSTASDNNTSPLFGKFCYYFALRKIRHFFVIYRNAQLCSNFTTNKFIITI